jgi:asparagine synthase (glutamine-hydrolysing)
VPIGSWFRNELKDMAYNAIFNMGNDGLLDRFAIEQIWKQHQRGFRERSTELWTLFMFRMWQRQFMAGK